MPICPASPRTSCSCASKADQLSVDGELALPLPKGMAADHAEVRLSRYRRAFMLSKEFDADKVNAELTQGLLRVRILKAEHAQPRKIAAQVN